MRGGKSMSKTAISEHLRIIPEGFPSIINITGTAVIIDQVTVMPRTKDSGSYCCCTWTEKPIHSQPSYELVL